MRCEQLEVIFVHIRHLHHTEGLHGLVAEVLDAFGVFTNPVPVIGEVCFPAMMTQRSHLRGKTNG